MPRCQILCVAAFLLVFAFSRVAAEGFTLPSWCTDWQRCRIRNFPDPPKITQRPQDLRVPAGGTAAFVCGARGDPTPTITWRKDGRRVSVSQPRHLLEDFPGGSLLTIQPVQDGGAYACYAKNGVGRAVSAVANLVVYQGSDWVL